MILLFFGYQWLDTNQYSLFYEDEEMRRLVRKSFVRFLGLEVDPMELPNRDWRKLEVPEGATGFEVYDEIVVTEDEKIKKSTHGNVQHYVFGLKWITTFEAFEIDPEGKFSYSVSYFLDLKGKPTVLPSGASLLHCPVEQEALV